MTEILTMLVVLATIAVVLLVQMLRPILQDELRGWLPILSERLIRASVRRLPKRDRDRWEEEWLAEVEAFINTGRPLTALAKAAHIRWHAREMSASLGGRKQPSRSVRKAAVSSAHSRLAIARLWLPTAASTSMLTFEIPMLLAIAARVGEQTVAIAGLGLALAIIVPINAGALALGTTSAVASELGWPRRAVRRYALMVGLIGCTVLCVIWSGWLDHAAESLLKVDPATWDATRATLRGLALAPLFVAVRRYNQGYLIASKQTGCFLPATLMRMLTSVVLAMLFTLALGWGSGGIGFALMIGVALEAAVLSYRSRLARATDVRSPTTMRLREISRVHAPLSGSTLLTVLPPTAVLLVLSASGGGARVLAAWAVLFGLAWLIAGTTVDLEPITASNCASGLAATRSFAVALGLALTAVWCVLTFDAAAGAYFRDFSGLSHDTAALAMSGFAGLLPFPLLCALREWLRGIVVARGHSPHTLAGVAVGLGAMLATLLVATMLRMGLVTAAATSVSIGAAAEVLALMLVCPGFGARSRMMSAPPALIR